MKIIWLRIILKEKLIDFGKKLILGKIQPQAKVSNLQYYHRCLSDEELNGPKTILRSQEFSNAIWEKKGVCKMEEHEMSGRVMKYWQGLVEWESGGFDDIPTSLLKQYLSDLIRELKKRGEMDE